MPRNIVRVRRSRSKHHWQIAAREYLVEQSASAFRQSDLGISGFEDGRCTSCLHVYLHSKLHAVSRSGHDSERRSFHVRTHHDPHD